MRHAPIDPQFFIDNRQRLKALLLPNSLAVVNANDIQPTSADGGFALHPNSDLFYLTGVEQEESILLLAPNAFDEKQREILFLRETNEYLKTWEGQKLTKAEAVERTGIKTVKWLSEFRTVFRQLMCEVEHVYLNSNEHRRASPLVETRDDRFIRDCQSNFPLHDYHRLAQLLYKLRSAKSEPELTLLRESVRITDAGFRRAAKFVQAGVFEHEIEAEFAHEFTRQRGKFSYPPIIASGANSCVLHYNANDQQCKKGDLLLLDVAANYANYNADLTRTIPVSGKFSRRQREVYDAVLRVLRASIAGAVVGKLHRDWQKEAHALMNDELLKLGLLHPADIQKQTEEEPACKKYFPHGLGHPLGLDVHDVGYTTEPFAAGWVLTVEPGIYIPKEEIGIRLENDIVVTDRGTVDLMRDIPLEADEIEELMNRK